MFLRLVRLVQSTGDGSLLWPKGVGSIEDCPNDLVMAFSHANYILNTSERLQGDEQPPHWMWAFAEELETHFERVQRAREKKYGGGKDDSTPDGWVENEYAKGIRG